MSIATPKASIVIPAYNTEAYIGRTLNCAAAQTESDIQVIVVDDGSTDGTLALAQGFASVDERFEVIHIENGGVSRARNIGLERVRGEKLFFLDSDDEFDEHLVEKCLAFAHANNVSAVLYGYSNQTEAGKSEPFAHELEVVYRGLEIRELLMPHFIGHSYADICDWIRGRKGMREGKEHTALWRVMLDTATVRNNGIRFNEALDLGEDTIFMNTYLSVENSVGFLDECLYWLSQREGSLNWTSNNDPIRMAGNKLKIIEEKNHLSRAVEKRTGFDLRSLYAGTQVLSALQLCLELGHYRHTGIKDREAVLSAFLNNETVDCCIKGFTPPSHPRHCPFLLSKLLGAFRLCAPSPLFSVLGLESGCDAE